MAALLILIAVVAAATTIIPAYLPSPDERREFRRATLRVRHSLTDWGAARRG
ncbi:hypothetical protein [Nocardia terpenica]|uniref:hypothetical protein n=1 Tax=Nocardia terpenica TaxID=455432 RepID=UPI00031218D8|nr:hypothetical protein [Nocardia terpenica]NQE89512.1 hypothetical protein [Nocardia terpenica]